MFNDLNHHEVNAEEIMTKYADYSTVAKLHHRKVHYDIVFSKTEELVAMEPLVEQLASLKATSKLSLLQIISNFKKRFSFFSLYSLFDRVETAESNSQASAKIHRSHQETRPGARDPQKNSGEA